MPLDFPTSPDNGDIYIDAESGLRYQYDETYGYWKSLANVTNQFSFAEIDSNGETILASSSNDIIRLIAGENININTNVDNNGIIISAAGGDGDIGPAFNQANIAYTHANNAYNFANTLPATIATARGDANAALVQAALGRGKANGAVQTGFPTVNTVANNLVAATNNDILIIRGGFPILVTGNTANNTLMINEDTTTLVAAFGAANTAYTHANNAYNFANTLPATIATARGDANAATVQAQIGRDKANGVVQLGWGTIIANGNTISAASNNDTLRFIAGANVKITTNVANGSIIISAVDTQGEGGPGGGGASVYIANTPPPAGNTANNLWWNSDLGKLSVWYDDGDTAQWVEANYFDLSTAIAAFDKANTTLRAPAQAVMEAASSNIHAVTPATQHFHPGHPKTGCQTIGSGSPTMNVTYNVTGITDQGVGVLTITIATDFSGPGWISVLGGDGGAAVTLAAMQWANNKNAGTIRIVNSDLSATPVVEDPAVGYNMVGLGDL